ncbi:MAG: serine--tRNA ligase [Candidatus Thermoplasmatota archaeon]|jgi:seryl-tRNA synthetase|nr:serine--tRNA ligase [Candidatus Thermoplasmatota archaeon]
MIDVKLLREKPELFYSSCEARGFGKDLLDKFFILDRKWRELLKQVNDLKHEKNELSMRISRMVKEGKDVAPVKEDVVKTSALIESNEAELKIVEAERDQILKQIPNLIDESVPICKGDENNPFMKFNGMASVYGEDVEAFLKATNGVGKYNVIDYRPMSHVDLQEKLGLVDLETAGRVAGSRFYYLKGRLFKLELALINYGVDFLSDRGFNVVEPPLMMNYESMSKATDMETFRESLYKIEGEDLYLISTSEHPIAAMISNEILAPQDLPLRIAGFSPCFRKEAGAHGKDTKGIFRVHNFNKVEQFIFCEPEKSRDFHEELLRNSEQLIQSLGLSYRVINFCSGELSVLNSKKYDIEAWFPSQGRFREVVSASNNTDYQARSLNIRYRTSDGHKFVHTLNSTALATTRILVAIMENFQNREGTEIKVPEPLVPYAGFDTISS